MRSLSTLFYVIFISIISISGKAFSQISVAATLPIVTLLDIEPAGNITLSFAAPTEAGLPLVNPAVNTTKWINYTSAIAAGGLTRRVTASVNQVIPGINIRLQAATASGSGGGTLGTPAAQVTLTTTAVNIITGIGGAFTGNGANNTYGNITSTNTPVVITYTITE